MRATLQAGAHATFVDETHNMRTQMCVCVRALAHRTFQQLGGNRGAPSGSERVVKQPIRGVHVHANNTWMHTLTINAVVNAHRNGVRYKAF